MTWVVKNLKRKNEVKKKIDGVRTRLSRIVDLILDMPPSSPMQFLVRNYEHAVHTPLFGWGEDRGWIASHDPDELDYHSAG